MSQAHGQWLRQQRQARGWDIPETGRKLRQAAESTGDTLPGHESLAVMIRRWENDRCGISERYRLHYCRAFQIPAGSYGDPGALASPHASGPAQREEGQAGGKQAGTAMTSLRRQSLAGSHEPPPRPVDLRDQMRAVIDDLDDPARRDQLCFMLGYVCAVISVAEPVLPSVPSGSAGPRGGD